MGSFRRTWIEEDESQRNQKDFDEELILVKKLRYKDIVEFREVILGKFLMGLDREYSDVYLESNLRILRYGI